MSTDEVVAVSLARIETKLDAALATQVDHEHRIRGLEERMSRLLAVAGVSGAAAGVLTGGLFSLVLR